MDKTSLFHKHLSKNLTDLDDGPLLDNNCVIGRRRRASLLVHEQSLQRSRHRLAWNTQTVAVTQTSVWKTHGHVFVVKTEKFIFIFLCGMVLIDKVTVVELKLLRGRWMTLRKSALWIKWSNCAVSQLKRANYAAMKTYRTTIKHLPDSWPCLAAHTWFTPLQLAKFQLLGKWERRWVDNDPVIRNRLRVPTCSCVRGQQRGGFVL